MPEKLDMPRLITDIIGTKDLTPGKALAQIYKQALAKEGGFTQKDIATLALIYAAHLSPLLVPFEVECLSLGALEERGYIKVTERGSTVTVEVLR